MLVCGTAEILVDYEDGHTPIFGRSTNWPARTYYAPASALFGAHWYFAVAFGLPPAAHFGPLVTRALGRRRRRRRGLCQRCGYDLRHTAGRCPECGAAPVHPSAGGGSNVAGG